MQSPINFSNSCIFRQYRHIAKSGALHEICSDYFLFSLSPLLTHIHTQILVALDKQADQINPYYILSEQDERAMVAFPNLVLIH